MTKLIKLLYFFILNLLFVSCNPFDKNSFIENFSKLKAVSVSTDVINERTGNKVTVELVGKCDPGITSADVKMNGNKITKVQTLNELLASTNSYLFACSPSGNLNIQYSVPEINVPKLIKFELVFSSPETKSPTKLDYEVNYQRPAIPPLILNANFRSLVNTNNISLSISGECAYGRIQGYSWRLNDGPWSSNFAGTCLSDGTWSWTPTVPFVGNPASTYKVDFRADNLTEAVLSHSDVVSVNLNVDTVAPATGPVILGLQSNSVDLVTDSFLGEGFPRIFWTPDVTAQSYSLLITSLDGSTTHCGPIVIEGSESSVQTTIANCNYNFLNNTEYSVKLSSTDFSNNISLTSSSLNFFADKSAPNIAFTLNPLSSTFDRTANFTFNVSGVISPLAATSECKIDNEPWTTCSASYVSSVLMYNMNHTMSVRHSDHAGNVGTISYAWQINQDITAPICNVGWPDLGWTNLNSRTFNFTCTDDDTVAAVECRLNGGTWASCSSTSTHILTGLSSDQYTFEVRARDNYSNYSTIINETWDVDLEAPGLTMNVLPLDPTLSDSVSFQFTESDSAPHPSGMATIQCQLDGGAFSICTNAPTLNGLSKGAHQFIVQLTDQVGNVFTSPTYNINIGAGGYFNCASGTCQSAGIGYYSPGGSDDNRYACGTGTFSAVTTASSCTSCTNKPVNATAVVYAASSAITSNSCPVASVTSCDIGWTPDGSVCRTACGAGLYWDGFVCADVGIGFYSPTADDLRYACPANSTTIGLNSYTINECLGAAGYYNCQSGSCSAAGIGYFSAVNDNARIQCPANRTTSITTASVQSQCLATSGYYGTDTSTAAIEVGLGYYSPQHDNSRYACAANRSTAGITSASVTDCLADAGYYGPIVSLAAVNAGAGYYSPALDNNIYPCAAGRFGSSLNNTNNQCDGACNPGNYCPASSTTAAGAGACPAGLYCLSGTGTPSLVCDANTYSIGGASTSSCTACPVNSKALGVLQSEHDSLADCIADPGFYNCQSGTCSQVGPGYYSPGTDNIRYVCPADTYSDSSNASVCTACPTHSKTYGVLDFNHNSPSSCLGDAGYYNCETGFCLTAGAGYFSASGDNTRTACGTGFYSSIATASICNVCTNMPANALTVTYSASSALTSNSCPVASVNSCAAGYAPNGVVCDDISPDAMAFTNLTNVQLSSIISSNALTLSGFDGAVTATCNLNCSAIARNGVWGGTSVAGFISGDTIAIRLNSSGTLLTTTTASVTVGASISSTWTVQTRPGADCLATPFGTVAHNSSVLGYSNVTPTPPTTCAGVSETRSCWDGVLSGSFTGTTCSQGCAATVWGNVPSGYSNTAYSSTTPTSSCASSSETRSCTNGTMSGSYTATTCNEPCAATPWGSMASGTSNTAYSTSSPAASCASVSEIRSCTNGVLSGSLTITSCSSGCTGTPWGNVSSGYSNTAYTSTTPASTCAAASEIRTCTNGTLSGSNSATSCTEGCTGTPWGSMASGTSNTAYSTSSPAASCASVSELRTCTSGVLSGSLTLTSCSSGCTGTPWGNVSSGYSNTAYTSTTPASTCTAASEIRTCTNGTLSGSNSATSCTNGCTGTPWGNVASGYSNTAYSSSSPAASCASVSETRTCTNGTLSGSNSATSCANGCLGTLWGNVSSGYSNIAYASSSATSPTFCSNISESRTCSNGIFSGSYSNTSCSQSYRTCNLPWGGTIAHLASTLAYASSNPSGSCSIETRTCNDGTLSGSYTSQNCTAGCTGTPWGSVPSGYSNTAYASSSPTGACSGETRTCNAGSLSGSYSAASCLAGCAAGSASLTSADGYNSCTFNWAAVSAGSSASTNCSGSAAGCSASGTCSAAGNGSYSSFVYTCDNTTVPVCNGGGGPIVGATKTCQCTWGLTNSSPSGTPVNGISCDNGGTATARCWRTGPTTSGMTLDSAYCP